MDNKPPTVAEVQKKDSLLQESLRLLTTAEVKLCAAPNTVNLRKQIKQLTEKIENLLNK
jgi:hypothetical protein